VKQNNFQSGVQTEMANSNQLQKKFILEPIKENTGKKKISVIKHIRTHKSSNKSINSFGSNANRLIKQDKKAQAMENIANAFRKLLLNVEQINTLGYEYLSEHNKNPDLAGIILKYNVLNNSRSANVYDSYGEALLAMNEPAAAKSQFLKAIELIELQDKDHRALNGFKANLVKAQLALKAQK